MSYYKIFLQKLLIGSLLLFLLLLLLTGYLISFVQHTQNYYRKIYSNREFYYCYGIIYGAKYMYPITNPGLDILQYPVILSIILLSDCFLIINAVNSTYWKSTEHTYKYNKIQVQTAVHWHIFNTAYDNHSHHNQQSRHNT